jgi:hypothetical protein
MALARDTSEIGGLVVTLMVPLGNWRTWIVMVFLSIYHPHIIHLLILIVKLMVSYPQFYRLTGLYHRGYMVYLRGGKPH